jgi:hypothetical protein
MEAVHAIKGIQRTTKQVHAKNWNVLAILMSHMASAHVMTDIRRTIVLVNVNLVPQTPHGPMVRVCVIKATRKTITMTNATS